MLRTAGPLFVAVLLALALPRGMMGQDGASGFIEVDLQTGPVADGWGGFSAIRGGLRFPEGLIVAGVARGLLGEETFPAGALQTDLRLDTHSWGLALGWPVELGPRWSVDLGVVLQAATGRTRTAVEALELGADNFWLVEPEARFRLPLNRSLSALGVVSYRIPLGVADLPGIATEDLRGLTLGIALGVGR